jgi:hypothetical protein
MDFEDSIQKKYCLNLSKTSIAPVIFVALLVTKTETSSTLSISSLLQLKLSSNY